MNREDDPEARIRELERPLTDLARASELGTGPQTGGGAYVPPAVPAYNAPDYSTPVYGAPQPYGSPAYGLPPGTPYAAPPRKVTAGISWVVFGVIAVVLVAIAAGVIVWTTKLSGLMTADEIGTPGVPEPSVVVPSIPSDPGVITAPPGAQVSIAGVEKNKTIACNDGYVNVSGVRNTVNITGHCVNVTVSGMNNIVTVDIADAISASGFDNRVTYHSGSPQIDSGESNVVEQG